MNSNYILLIVGVVACFAQSVNSIRCFQCSDSEADKKKCGFTTNCNSIQAPAYILAKLQPHQNWGGNTQYQNNYNDYNNINLVASGCVKRVVRRSYSQNREMVRGCFFGDLVNTTLGCTADPNYPIQESCHVCAHDECNSSTSIIPKTAMILIMATVLALFEKFIYN